MKTLILTQDMMIALLTLEHAKQVQKQLHSFSLCVISLDQIQT